MKKIVKKKQILKELKNLLIKEFSGFIDKVVLFGSQATGTSREYSDYDILVILKKDYDWQLEDAILSSCYEIDLKYDIVTDVKLISKNELETIKGKQPFIINALEQGIMV
ncbi:MAG: nucleotidyltransferase domain-containing protein [Candidatus Aminicenantes bacterium]|nr:nucleotidyltransferase domain-containing protein [Candidatus Aminicenantes bacterium]